VAATKTIHFLSNLQSKIFNRDLDDRKLVLDFIANDKSSIFNRESSMIQVGGDRQFR